MWTVFLLLAFLVGVGLAPSMAADKPKVLLLPLKIHAPEDHHAFLKQGLRSMFISRLTGEGLDMVGEDETAALLQGSDQEGIDSEERAELLTRRSGAGYGIFGSVTTLGGGYSLDLAILDLTKTPPKLTRISEATQQDQLIPKLADVAYRFRAVIEGIDYRRLMAGSSSTGEEERGTLGLFFRASEAGQEFQPAGYTSMRMGVMSFDMGDLNGDGVSELVITGRNKLVIAKRDGDILAMKDRLDVVTGEEFLRVSVADVDKDGQAEIYLVRLYGKRAQTSVYTWDGAFQERFSQAGHLNAVHDAQTGRSVLLFQNSKLENLFVGDVYRMVYEGPGKPRRGEPIPFEEGVQLYTLAFADINRDAMGEFLGLQENGYLCVWSTDGTLLWEGNTKLEGSNNAVEMGQLAGTGDDPTYSEITGRVMVADLDGDGQREVLAAKNIAGFDMLERLRIYKTSRILAYKSGGSSTLTKTWTTRRINYSIADMQVDGSTLYLAGHKGQFSKMSVESSRIMWFE